MKIRFLYMAKPRRFEYKPRYHDPEKEARERRRDELLGPRPSSSDNEYVPGEIIRSRMGARAELMKEQRRTQKRSTIVMLVVLAALLVASIWIILSL